MRVAIVIPIEWHASAFTVDPRILAQGFEAIGHQATIVCLMGSSYPVEAPALTASGAEMEDVEYWRDHGFDVALVFTWMHSHRGVLASIARSGTFVISKGDTDGLYGARAQPLETLRSAIRSTGSSISASRNAWYWLKRLALVHEHQSYALPFLRNLREADLTVVETEVARANVCRFLESLCASELASKLRVVPNPVASPFVEIRVTEERERLIYAIGRWESHEKNAALLGHVLHQYLARDSKARVVIAGTGAERFRGVHVPRVETVGQVDRATLAEIAARSRLCLITSRRESFHLGGHEALATGATVVGTSIPAVRNMTSNGSFGTMASSHRVASVSGALTHEMSVWDRGGRDPIAIASHWRAKLAPEAVASQLIRIAAMS